MMRNNKVLVALAAAACGWMLSGPAGAAMMDWNLVSGGCSTTAGSGGFGNTRTCAASPSGPSVTVSAWSFTGPTSNTTLENAFLGSYAPDNGVGVTHREASSDTGEGSSPEHAIDNDGRYDLVLLSFAQSVQLNSLTIGWRDTDSDLSVLAYTGAAVFSGDLTGKSATTLNTEGWTLVGNYDGPSGDSSSNVAIPVNTGSVGSELSSMHWLVATYNPNFISTGGQTETIGSPSLYKKDYVKLLLAAGKTRNGGQAPEPGTAFLLGAAVIGGFWSRRRSRREA